MTDMPDFSSIEGFNDLDTVSDDVLMARLQWITDAHEEGKRLLAQTAPGPFRHEWERVLSVQLAGRQYLGEAVADRLEARIGHANKLLVSEAEEFLAGDS